MTCQTSGSKMIEMKKTPKQFNIFYKSRWLFQFHFSNCMMWTVWCSNTLNHNFPLFFIFFRSHPLMQLTSVLPLTDLTVVGLEEAELCWNCSMKINRQTQITSHQLLFPQGLQQQTYQLLLLMVRCSTVIGLQLFSDWT